MMIRLAMPFLKALEWVYQTLPWPASARNKLRLAFFMLATMTIVPMVALWCHITWLTTAFLPLSMVMGWCAGRLIGATAIQRGEERAADHVQRMLDGEA